MNQRQLQKEWQKLNKAEEKFLKNNLPQREDGWKNKVKTYVPNQLENTLQAAFCKAFSLIFEKGTTIIEKTYDREKLTQEYQIQEYAAELTGKPGKVKMFTRSARTGNLINTAISTAEGAGMGLLGLGLPDIPVFLSLLLKSIYEIALHYGYSYDSANEQIFIMKIIENALLHDTALLENNEALNDWIEKPETFSIPKTEQIQKASDALAREMLYLKFIQGIPVVGMLGGISDVIYQKKIKDYAMLKYQRRFLLEHLQTEP